MKPIANTCEYDGMTDLLNDMLFFSNSSYVQSVSGNFQYYFQFYRFGEVSGRSNSAQD